MTKIKLLALDMDGTTLRNDHNTLSPANRAAIEAVVKNGIHVVTATGRTRGRIPEQVAAIPALRYAVTSNGAAVIDLQTGETLYSNPLSKEEAFCVVDTLAELPVFFEAYCDGKSYVAQSLLPLADAFPIPPGRIEMMRRTRVPVEDLRAFLGDEQVTVEKFTLPYLPPEIQQEVWSRLGAIDGVALTSSVPQNCEVNHATANKADGLSHLCVLLGIAPAEVMAIGDNRNDLELLQFAGLAVSPANATEEIKSVCAYVTASNEEDGVAEAIRRFLL